MADFAIQPASEDQDGSVERFLAETEFRISATDEAATGVSRAVSLPLSAVPALGTALASLPEAARTAAMNINAPALLTVTDKFGNPIDPAILNRTAGGMIGSFGGGSVPFGQARFHQVDAGAITAVSTMPYDPTALFMAAAVAQINQKLDAIQASVDEMFSYVRQGDKSSIRGNIRVLEAILRDYGVNCDNPTYMANAHMKVLDIKQRAMQDLDKYSKLAEGELEKKKPLEVRRGVGKRLGKTLDYLKDCQLSLYAFSFAAFLDPMLARNFKPEKLDAVARAIEEESIRYRVLYTRCYDAIEASTEAAVDTAVLGGVAQAATALGKAIEKTAVGERTPIDEGLGFMGEGLRNANEGVSEKLMAKLRGAKSPELRPFEESLETVNRLCNRPSRLAVDKETVYILPADEPTAAFERNSEPETDNEVDSDHVAASQTEGVNAVEAGQMP